MSKIAIQDMTFYYDDFYHPVFDRINLLMDTDWKLGLIGRNGRGKTTLLKLLNQELQPTSGMIQSSGKISYFPYSCDETYTSTLDVVKETIGGLTTIERKMQEFIEQYEAVSHTESLNEASLNEASFNIDSSTLNHVSSHTGSSCEDDSLERYYELYEKYSMLHGYEIDALIHIEMERMNLSPDLLMQEYATLSGGEKTCMQIIALFLRKDSFVLLDEPTNHLDLHHKEALAAYLKKKKGFILVSHDTAFLNDCVDHILAINKATISLEQGNYETWKENMRLKELYDLRTQQRLVQEIAQLERQSEKTRSWSDTGNQQKYEFACNARTNGTRAYMRQAKRAEQQILDNIEEKKTLLRNLEEEKLLTIKQNAIEDCLIQINDLQFGYQESQKIIFDHFNFVMYPGERIWIRGRNGAGKSTLLRLIAGELGDVGIEHADLLTIAYAAQEPEVCSYDITQLLKQEQFIELCKSFDIPEDFTQRPIETLSTGEQKKVDLARCLSCENQLLILDEPLNYMDVNFKMQLQKALLDHRLSLIFVEHDETFARKIATRSVFIDRT